jgi:uncharacterized protein involved in exopolysaccharide biosynthesis
MSDAQVPMTAQRTAQHTQQYARYDDDEIDLLELWNIVWAGKWLIVAMTAAAVVLSVIFALLQTNIYRAEAVLAPAESGQSAGGGLASQFGGAAALLGVNLGGSGGSTVTTAIAIMTSREFIGRFIEERGLLVPLFAGKWDNTSKTSLIDPETYDEQNQRWLLENGQPTQLEAYRKFNEVLNISAPNRDTGLVNVSIDWQDPVLASRWVNQLVADINRDIRLRDVAEANNAISYLRQQLEATQLVEMQRVFFQLIESQTRITMLADVRDEYVFRVIDSAVVPDQKVAPRRSLIAIIGTMAGGMFALILVFIRHAMRTAGENNKKLQQT